MPEPKIRQWLIDARKVKGLTQEEVATSVGVTRTTYARYEMGERTPRPKIADALAHTLNVHREHFFWDQQKE